VAFSSYQPGLPHTTVEERRRNLVGFAEGVFETAMVVESILSTTVAPSGLDLYFFAANAPADALPLYRHPSRLVADPPAPRTQRALVECSHWSGALKVADRSWTFIAVPVAGGPGTASHWGSWLILAGGALLSCIVAAYLWSTDRYARRLQHSNKARTPRPPTHGSSKPSTSCRKASP
jgi:hypothetical protein